MRLHLVALVSTITMTRCVPPRMYHATAQGFSSSRFVGIAQLCEISERGARNRVNYTANNWSRGRWIELVLPRGREIETNDYWMTERDRHQGSRWLVPWNRRSSRQLRVFVFVTHDERSLWRSTFIRVFIFVHVIIRSFDTIRTVR